MSTRVPLDFSKLVEKIAEEDGIFIQNLRPEDRLRIETEECYLYEFIVVSPEKKLVYVIRSNSPYIPQRPVVMHMGGSLLTDFGSAIRDGWISLGHRLELNGWVLMPTTRVTVNGQDIFSVQGRIQ